MREVFHVEHSGFTDIASEFRLTPSSPLLGKLLRWSREAGADITEEQAARLLFFAMLICRENQTTRLTGTLQLEEIVRKHVFDSLTAAPLITGNKRRLLLDIGSGAGFPGMVLGIAKPQVRVSLLESSKKKCEFLKRAAFSTGIEGLTILNDRAENAGKNISCREAFDVVVCRAVAHLSVITEYALPFLKTGGVFIAYKGRSAEEEIGESGHAFCELGGALSRVVKIALPEGGEERRLILLKKERPAHPKYPRREGIPGKRPLRD
jgi:16S rRNA (guanine527-N7)-methyltransferase